MTEQQTNWWHDDFSHLAAQLGKGALREMHRRILTSNIQKEKLQPGERTDRMRAFFEREIQRYTKRRTKAEAKQKEAERQRAKTIEAYQNVIKRLWRCNQSLAKKCERARLSVARVHCFGSVYSWE